ncbi:hypothetical protein LINPERHAP2_LOCUS32778 [Linum perenne]
MPKILLRPPFSAEDKQPSYPVAVTSLISFFRRPALFISVSHHVHGNGHFPLVMVIRGKDKGETGVIKRAESCYC